MYHHGGTSGETREKEGIARKECDRVFGMYHEWYECEHGGKEVSEKQ